jgi:hypothetical protein
MRPFRRTRLAVQRSPPSSAPATAFRAHWRTNGERKYGAIRFLLLESCSAKAALLGQRRGSDGTIAFSRARGHPLCSDDVTARLRPATELSVGGGRGHWPVFALRVQLKGELGLDEYEGHGYIGFHHHCALVTCAHAFLGTLVGAVSGSAQLGVAVTCPAW